MKKNFLIFSGVLVACIAFYLMRKNDHTLEGETKGLNAVHELRIGVTAGPHATIMNFVKTEAEKQGLRLKVIEFNDFILPNAALDHGDITMNSYQHKPFLDEQIRTRNYQLSTIATSVVIPMGIYAFSLKSLAELKNGATVLIPNDATNGSRALLLLEKAGILVLKKIAQPTILDIESNPKNIIIKELDAPSLPRAMVDADIAVINTDWLFVAGLDPSKALFKEDKNSPYANILVVQKSHEQDEVIKKFVALYHSQVVRQFIEKEFKGAVIPAF